MTKTSLFRMTLIVTIVMMLLGGANLTITTSAFGIALLAIGILGFFASPFIAQLGKNEDETR